LLALLRAGSEQSIHSENPATKPGLQESVLPLVEEGRNLFLRNCAHCHGDDARGDEGPTLYDLTLSDDRIRNKVLNGIRGEMPRFSSKLNEADLGALIAFIRTLKS
jgi:mono/diheme cytochrome c family protein